MPKKPSPITRNLIFAGTLAAIFVFSIYLRFEGIDTRAMHSDEAVQAYRVGEMLAGKTFVYNPQDFHGPTLYFFTFWLCKIFGIASFAELTETLVRAVPAIVGALGCVLIPLSFFGKKILPVALAGTLLAASQIAAFYSGYFIQETILVVFAWTAAGIWFFREKNLLNALLAGICAGIAVASKETWLLMAAAFALGGAGIILLRRHFHEPGESAKQFAKRLGIATVAAGTIAALFYSSFGQNPGGLADFFVAFKNYFFTGTNSESPHGKSFFYYAKLLSQNERWLLFFAGTPLALFLLRTFFPTRKERKFGCRFMLSDFSKIVFTASATLAILILYSLLPYKTPWCVLGLIPGIALMPALVAESRVLRTIYENRIERGIIAIFLFWALCRVPDFGKSESGLRYEHPYDDIVKIFPVIEKSKANFIAGGGNPENFFVALVGPEYWPLPWYLRRERVGWWKTISEVPPPAAVTVAEIEIWLEADATGTATKKSRTIFCAGLRPGVIVEARENFVEAD